MSKKKKGGLVREAIKIRKTQDLFNDKNYDKLVEKYPEIKNDLEKAYNAYKNTKYLISPTSFYYTNQHNNNSEKLIDYIIETIQHEKSISKQGSYSVGSKYGNCHKYAKNLFSKLEDENINSIQLIAIKLDHVANLIEINNHFFLLDRWANSGIVEITKENYCDVLPFNLFMQTEHIDQDIASANNALNQSKLKTFTNFLHECDDELRNNDIYKKRLTERMAKGLKENIALLPTIKELENILELEKVQSRSDVAKKLKQKKQIEFNYKIFDECNKDVEKYLTEIVKQEGCKTMITLHHISLLEGYLNKQKNNAQKDEEFTLNDFLPLKNDFEDAFKQIQLVNSKNIQQNKFKTDFEKRLNERRNSEINTNSTIIS